MQTLRAKEKSQQSSSSSPLDQHISPSDTDLKKRLYNAVLGSSDSLADKESGVETVKQWMQENPNDKCFIRGSTDWLLIWR